MMNEIGIRPNDHAGLHKHLNGRKIVLNLAEIGSVSSP